MNIEQANENWTKLGEIDPMWAVLTAEDKRGGKWNTEQFFATGREEIREILQNLQRAGVNVHPGTALDFGCGPGRLSQALAEHFERVDGVDVSTSMIKLAKQHNKYPEKVEYHLNVKTDLGLFPRERFDFIYSCIVLQHIPTKHQLSYIAEFMNLLKVGGVARFQTIHAHGWRALFPDWFVERYRFIKHRGQAYIPMYGVRPAEVEKIIQKSGCRLERKETVPNRGSEQRFFGDYYLVVKPRANA